MREIARKAGVSPATVSRYLTGAGMVSPKASAKVAAVVDGLSETEIPRTRAGKYPLVCVLVPDLKLQYYIDVMREVMEQIGGFPLDVVYVPEARDGRHLDVVRTMYPSGLILLNENIEPNLLALIESKDLRAVVCGGANTISSGKITAVHINDLAAGYEGTKHLIGLGHQRIAFMGDYPKTISGGFQRITGARQAMEQAGLVFDEALWRCGEMTDDTGYALTRELLTADGGTKSGFSALFAFSDQMAAGAVRALHDAGLRVPEDVSVMGFDDLPIAEAVRPRLTTIHQSLKSIVTSVLSQFVAGSGATRGAEINMPFSIVERESCKRRA